MKAINKMTRTFDKAEEAIQFLRLCYDLSIKCEIVMIDREYVATVTLTPKDK